MFLDNPSLGLPSLGGLIVLPDARTGIPRAALFDNGELTNLRTALAGGGGAVTGQGARNPHRRAFREVSRARRW